MRRCKDAEKLRDGKVEAHGGECVEVQRHELISVRKCEGKKARSSEGVEALTRDKTLVRERDDVWIGKF